jgi:hypothetical protein
MRSKYLLTPEQHRARAELLRQSNPNSRAAELAELAARAQELAAHKRRAGLIAQLHKQAITAADDISAWQEAINARVAICSTPKDCSLDEYRGRLYRSAGLHTRPFGNDVIGGCRSQ